MLTHLQKILVGVGEVHRNIGTHSLHYSGASAVPHAIVPEKILKRRGWPEGRSDSYVKDNVNHLLSVSRSLCI